MASISTTVIANLALSHLGVSPILSLDDNQKQAKVMNLWFDPTRDETIRMSEWTFARSRSTLARLTDTPEFTWNYQYQLPVNPKCLRVLRLMEDYNYSDYKSFDPYYTGEGSAYVIEGDRLLTNFETASIIFLKRVTDPTKFDALFVTTLALRLAMNACFDITGSMERHAQLTNLFNYHLNIAAGISAKEHYRTRDRNYDWVNAGRFGAVELNEFRLE